MKINNYVKAIGILQILMAIGVSGMAQSSTTAPKTTNEALTRVHTAQPSTPTYAPTGEQVTVFEVASLPKCKLDYMRAHPEEYTFRTDGKVEMKAASNNVATYAPSADRQSAPVVYDPASLPQSKLDYMRAHPNEFTFRQDGKVEMKVVGLPAPSMQKIAVTPEFFATLTPTKKDYILAHPEQYNLTRGSTNK